MKKYTTLLICLFLAIFSASAQVSRKSKGNVPPTYKLAEIRGIWLADSGFRNSTQEWEDIDPEEGFGFLFTDVKVGNMFLGALTNEEGTLRLLYTFKQNVIKLHDTETKEEYMSIKVLSIRKNESMTAIVSMTDGNEAKIKFIKIEEKN